MASQMYGKGREKFGNGEIDWVDDDIRAVLVDTDDYTIDVDVDEFLSSIAVGARVATATLSGKSNTLGTLDATDLTFSAVTGDECEAIVLYKYNADPAAAALIAYLDQVVGLPVTPNGEDIVVIWDASGIMVL